MGAVPVRAGGAGRVGGPCGAAAHPGRGHGPAHPAQFDEAVAFLEESLRQPGSVVYVHCRAGAQRTAAILVAFHGRRHGLGYDAALQELRRRRPLLNPLPVQEAATRRWLAG